MVVQLLEIDLNNMQIWYFKYYSFRNRFISNHKVIWYGKKRSLKLLLLLFRLTYTLTTYTSELVIHGRRYKDKIFLGHIVVTWNSENLFLWQINTIICLEGNILLMFIESEYMQVVVF